MLKVKTGLDSAVDTDGAAIIDSETGILSTLNPTGADVWTGLCRGTSLETIVSGLAAETGESVTSLEPDVQRFVEQLKIEGLLQD